jgi:DNA-binding HxlR family transcriptional regulator
MSEQIMSAVPEVSDFEMVRGTRRALTLLGGKWSVEVLYLLASGTRRYSEVLYEVGEISKKTLTQTLRALERDGLISRRAYPEVPPRVEYSLTAKGEALVPLIDDMRRYGSEWLGVRDCVPAEAATAGPVGAAA